VVLSSRFAFFTCGTKKDSIKCGGFVFAGLADTSVFERACEGLDFFEFFLRKRPKRPTWLRFAQKPQDEVGVSLCGLSIRFFRKFLMG
jgi:hypothetical protein